MSPHLTSYKLLYANYWKGQLGFSKKIPEGLNEEQFTHLFNIILLGDYGVGKTAFFRRFVDEPFNDKCRGTVGVDYRAISVYNGELIKLLIWC